MTFYQEYTRQEKYFGQHTLRFVVSDKFEDLFKETWDAGDGIFADIFQTGDVALKLEDENNSQGVDELVIDVYQSLCRTDNELNAFFFFLEARDINQNRFCTLLFDPVYVDGIALDSCVWFIGKISEKMQATDVMWRRTGDYAKVITPVRVWKCKAYSLDISLFDKIKVYGKDNENRITLPDGSTTLPLLHLDRITESEISDIFNFRLAWMTDMEIGGKYVYYYPLGNIFKVIKLLLDHATDIIGELTNTTFQITLLESLLNILTSYVFYSFKLSPSQGGGTYIASSEITKIEIYDYAPMMLKMSDSDDGVDGTTGLEFSSPFIHRRLVNPHWHLVFGEEITDQNMEEDASLDERMSFISFDTLTLLLHEIARSLNCYLFVNTTVSGGITLAFKPKDAFIKDDIIRIKDSVNASFNISSQISSGGSNVYFAQSTIYSADGGDIIINNPYVEKKDLQTKRLIKEGEQRKYDKDVKNINTKILLLSASWTAVTNIDPSGKPRTFALNTVASDLSNITYTDTNYVSNFSKGEILHNSLYFKTKTKEGEMISRLGEEPVWRPVSKIWVKHNEENKEYENLTKYINDDAKISIQYYENTYDITIPWWSAFSKEEDGSSPSWGNLEIGSKVPLNEFIRLFNGSSWLTYLPDNDVPFTVTAITRSTQHPETKIKLVNESRYAYGVWSGEINSMNIISYTFDNLRNIDFLVDGIKVKNYDVASGCTVNAGEAVYINTAGMVLKSIPKSTYRGLSIGIALESGNGDDDDTRNIAVQLIGNVYCEDWAWSSDDIGKQVFVRNSLSGINISTSLLIEPTSEEDMIIYLGIIDSTNSIKLDIAEYKLEEALCQV